MDSLLYTILSQFPLKGEPVSCERYGMGHVNETYLVVTSTQNRYILQKLSERAFHNMDHLMENVVNVTTHLQKKVDEPRCAMNFLPTRGGGYYVRQDGCWRICDFVENTICLQRIEREQDFYESAIGFGTFQSQLGDFAVEKLHETIPNFHHTPNRYRLFREALQRDTMGRAGNVQREIDFVLSKEEEMATLQRMRESGALPVRVTHNDTKLNNVLLDAATRRAVCVIDLDTVMPGLSAYDFGDSIRFGAATASEDERDLDRMTIDLRRYEIFTCGFLTACRGFTPTELEMLPMGAKTMTMECGVRFLTDYLDGDHYFAIHREGHNLDRARTQFRLVTEMERNWEDMGRILRAVAGR